MYFLSGLDKSVARVFVYPRAQPCPRFFRGPVRGTQIPALEMCCQACATLIFTGNLQMWTRKRGVLASTWDRDGISWFELFQQARGLRPKIERQDPKVVAANTLSGHGKRG
jgi:hypothetical protein